MKKQIQNIILLGISVVLFAGCGLIDENMDNCPVHKRQIEIYFNFPVGEKVDIDIADLEYLSVYVFDSANRFVGCHVDEHPELLRPDYHITIFPEDDEKYSFVCWGDAAERYGYTVQLPPIGSILNTLEEARVILETGENKVRDKPFAHLFYARPVFREVSETGTEIYKAEVQQNTYTIHLTTEGLQTWDNEYKMDIVNEYDTYTFSNKPVLPGCISFTQPCIKDHQGQLSGQVRTLGLRMDSPAEFRLYNSSAGYISYRESLISLILEANRQGAGIDFNSVHNFYLKLVFDPLYMSVKVYVNGWNVKENAQFL